MKKIYHILTLSLVIFISCEEKPSVEEDKFVKVYVELISAPDSISVDSTKFFDYKKKVFSNFNLTEKDYEQTVKFYNKDPKRWGDFFNKVVKHIEAIDDSSKTSL
ncbi:MAG: DUF4296 domain-containing protein [Ignavibacterium sp.]|uniref:DUF4296 domain-containing protein n=1 Tax=Ignavibacterium sp. TaxID=2651167 RepID=UPI00404A55D4